MAQNLTPGEINALNIEVSIMFDYTYDQIFGGPKNWARAFSQDAKTDQDRLDLPFFDSELGLRLGSRGVPVSRRNKLGSTGFVDVLKYEDGIQFSTHDLSQDRTGILKTKSAELAQGVAFFPRDQQVDALVNGATATYNLFDGVPLFDNAHPRGGTTFDNLSSGVLNAANFQALRTAQVTFPSDGGAARPIGRGAEASHLIIPSALFETGSELMNNNFVPGGSGEADNILKGAATLIEIEELTDVNDWYLVKADFVVKPFIHVKKIGHSPFKITQTGTTTADPEFEQEVVAFIGWTYERVFPTRPELFIKSVN